MNESSKITIREGSIADCLTISEGIPEFSDGKYGYEVYQQRLSGTRHLILVAFDGTKPVGFKVGYQKDQDGSFYSWMGGVLPDYRRLKIAKQLADIQEDWAKKNGYGAITFKTRNYLKPMLVFGLSNGFYIQSVEPQPRLEDYRIILRKEL